jgi:hypothetical protein
VLNEEVHMLRRLRKQRAGEVVEDPSAGERHVPEGVGRFSTGQETTPEAPGNSRIGRFSDGQEKTPDGAGTDRQPSPRQAGNAHGLPHMEFRAAFARRKEVTSRASEQGLIEEANRTVFHDRGYTLTWDTATGDLWLTPTDRPEGWWYEEDVG